MLSDRHAHALLVHALGWAALLVTAFVARSDTIGTGWFSWFGLALGTLLFVGLTTWSGMQVLRRLRSADDVSAPVGCHACPRTTMSWPTHHRYGPTTIRHRSDNARR